MEKRCSVSLTPASRPGSFVAALLAGSASRSLVILDTTPTRPLARCRPRPIWMHGRRRADHHPWRAVPDRSDPLPTGSGRSSMAVAGERLSESLDLMIDQDLRHFDSHVVHVIHGV